MKEFKVLLNSIVDVKKFVNTVSKYDFDIDFVSDRYVVDAKSIMGIFSLDLSKEIKLNIYSDNCENLINELKEYEVK